MAPAITLHEYLTRPNPTIQLQGNLAEYPCYTTNPEYPIPTYIRRWSEFNLKTISQLFGQRLQQTLHSKFHLHDFSHIHPSYCKIHDEDSLEALIVKSNQSIILESLEHTSQDLLFQGVSMVRGGQAQLYYTWRDHVKKTRSKQVEKKRGKWFPDWAGLVDVQHYNNILPGDTKLSKNWRSRDLKRLIAAKGQRIKKDDEGSNVIWPVRQLIHYCIESHMRYGYIITDEELVVMRVGPLEEYSPGATLDELHGAARESPVVEFQSIPWKRTPYSKALSVNLALYVLFILAANNGCLDWEYCSLVDEKLPTSRPKKSLCDEYPSFSTLSSSGVYSQGGSSNVEVHRQESLATSSSTQMVGAATTRLGRKRPRGVSSPQREEEGPQKGGTPF
ncbi:hypothetical protein F5Y07DRAFT_411356 [Xylaria sp. FL0933]|nr:hypothetical protein F5Y07DRAFT_411356 [Xylaria sp. FL0933]